MEILLVYLLIINAVGFFLMLADKEKAKKHRWRIPERTLLGVAVLGGSLGTWAGIYAFRHKTRHLQFTLGVPLIFSVQMALALWLLLA